MKTYIVHGLKNHKNIVGVCALISVKRRATYVELLTEAQQLTHNAIPHTLMADFQSCILSTLNRIYSDIPQVEYLFNLSRNVFRRVLYIELKQTYLTDLLFRGNI